ncbi:inositol monophosphatase [Kaistia dalseonensis]|uniref:Myo-inositol-1(Or 4)-monophosphatase n=1 Tax=Kaistia dalseonensis TaxID=410840 RepID=A0ABU0HAL9_9HYPH|nr:inositol monophosphatase family protein [Kaistia dalseonensis]MCX5496728.1 inositol monophosphatase [Kaistia dalseonensis]MDQ0439354.1 myo-inositol-1(or 4)-monophosphatase [Kaistia dalseonensis]
MAFLDRAPFDPAKAAPTERTRHMLDAALAGAAAIAAGRERVEGAALTLKGQRDFQTQSDVASERAITAHLTAIFPDHGLQGEEETDIDGTAGRFLIDPIDGTTNFAWGLPFFGICIALVEDGETVAGVVYDPSLEEAFVAERGLGAFVNGRRLAINRTLTPDEAVIGASLPVPGQVKTVPVEDYHRALRAIMDRASGMRRLGSAALSLCYVAAGRHDAFFEDGLSPHDYAAAALIASEAGAIVSGFDGAPIPASGAVLASNASLHPWLVELLSNRA